MRKRFVDASPTSFPLRAAVLVLLVPATATAETPAWTQWGGPTRDFRAGAEGLAPRWPDSGPRQLWRRALGPGHSAILCEAGRLYTMYRAGDRETAVAIDAQTGQTLWEHSYAAPAKPDMQADFCIGPHATPLIVGDRLFTVGGTVILNCLDKHTGKLLWTHDLMDRLGASHVGRGYGPSPIAYDDLVILNVGGGQAGVAAFRQDTGDVAWLSEPLRPGQSSPILARIAGDDHLIVALAADRAGLDPRSGAIRWRLALDRQAAAIMSTPVFLPPDRVFFSSAYGGGSYVIRVTKAADGRYAAEQVWHDKRLKVQHGNVVVLGELAIGSSGDFGPAFMMAVRLSDGELAWRQRGFAKATLLCADGRLIILDEEGNLALATASPEGLTVLSRAKPLQEKAWTAPTLVGTRLYLRDLRDIVALDLSAAGNS
ncbi:MAG: PQQ-like beta-propeller repeat protein [Phycisphaerae bacterium]|nr:PQQ-binding-like beta-propeller repeat protein [Phycisphaerae bacterium]MCZ2400940.1 PQQ-like beta-propeller repeat protein [Phycisphaerae bacterium]